MGTLKFIYKELLFVLKLGLIAAALALISYYVGGALAGAKQKSRIVRVLVLDDGYVTSPTALPCEGATQISLDDSPGKGHGNNVASLISQYAGPYACVTMFQIYIDRKFSYVAYLKALEFALKEGYDIINYSSSSTESGNLRELYLLDEIHKAKIHFVAAAGNKRAYMGRSCAFYPACHKAVTVVGNLPGTATNYGPRINVVEDGQNKSGGGYTLSGTSMSAAIHSGKLARKIYKERTK